MNDFESYLCRSGSTVMPHTAALQVSLVPLTTETATFVDGFVAAWGPDNTFLVTSPNVAFVPEIVQGTVSVCLRDDGAFGKHDPTYWPQVFASRFPYLAAIPKGVPTTNHPHAPIWALEPSQEQFTYLSNSPVRGFGRFCPQFLRTLEPLVEDISSRAREYVPRRTTIDLSPLRHYETTMSRAWERLQTICATYRDQRLQVGTVRRYWLLCSGFMTYYDLVCQLPSPQPLPVNRQLMGAWTAEPQVAQRLFALGIPVWLVRASHLVGPDVRVRTFVAATCPPDALCHTKFHGGKPICQGLAGELHLAATLTEQTYRDISRMPTANLLDPDDYCVQSRGDGRSSNGRVSALESGERQGSSARSRQKNKPKAKRQRLSPYDQEAQDRTSLAHRSQIRGRDKFIDPDHPWMPPSQPTWDRAMRAVDRSGLAKLADELWGYWIPEPALLLGPRDHDRVKRYVMNWLIAQPVWLYMLQVPGSGAVKVPPLSWRNFLNGVPEEPTSTTRTGKRFLVIKQIFGRVFSDRDLCTVAAGESEVEWHQRRVSDAALDADPQLGPCILWEIFELGFRYELLALDRVLRPQRSAEHVVAREAIVAKVFPSNSLWTVSHLPTEDAWGLFAPLPHRRINSLNALGDILRSWMRCPPEIRNAKPLLISDSQEHIEELEGWMALYYTQTFFDASGRAPIVPHRWPGLGPKS